MRCSTRRIRAARDRIGLDVRWEEYMEGGDMLLGGHSRDVKVIVAFDGRCVQRVLGWVFSGLEQRTT